MSRYIINDNSENILKYANIVNRIERLTVIILLTKNVTKRLQKHYKNINFVFCTIKIILDMIKSGLKVIIGGVMI